MSEDSKSSVKAGRSGNMMTAAALLVAIVALITTMFYANLNHRLDAIQGKQLKKIDKRIDKLEK